MQNKSISLVDKFDSDRICFIDLVGNPWKPFNLFNLSSGIAISKLPSLYNAEDAIHKSWPIPITLPVRYTIWI